MTLAKRRPVCDHFPMRPLVRHLAFAISVLLASAPSLAAQRLARLEGEVTDSLHMRPLAGAVILVTRLEANASDFLTALADERGRFRLDSLAAGRYVVTVAHAILDSLDLTLPPREVDIAEGGRARLELALPSGATLRARACPGIGLPRSTGAVVGILNDAERDEPLAGATVAVDWMDMTLDRTTMRPSLVPRSASVRTDSTGAFRFCGVPTDTYLLVQVQRNERAGSVVRITVPDAVGVTVLRLSFSEAAARALAAAGDTVRDESALPPLTGTASVSGVVRSLAGQPLEGAEVRVMDAASVSRTDASGTFTLSALPAGTQLLEVRRVGYLVTQQRLELRGGRTSTADVTLRTIVTLDSVRVVAQRTRYREATDRQRRAAGSGTFLTDEQISRLAATETSELFQRMGGFRVSGDGLAARLYVQRGLMSIVGGPCPANIVIDGFQHQDINLVRPAHIGIMEIYRGPAGAPTEYESACGVVVIWTKR